jgi:uncharacterized protein involved in exopolysaccharide biosynthesis
LEESLAVLRSRSFTQSFIGDRQLENELLPKERSGLFSQWFGGSEETSLADAYRYFDRRVRSVSQDRRTGLVTLQIEWIDPVKAAQWANELVARLNAEMRRRAIASAAAATQYLERELAATTVIDTRQAITRLMEAQINRGMLANVTQEYAFRVVDTALAPDLGDPVRPRRALLLALGAFLGGLIGCAVALVVPQRRKLRGDVSDAV